MNRYKIIATVHLFLKNSEGEVLLQQRKNTGYHDGKFSLIGGHLEAGETLKEALIREAFEEIGIKLLKEDLSLIYTSHRKKENSNDQDRMDFFFTTKKFDGNIEIKEIDKADKLKWFQFTKLPLELSYYIKDFLENYEQTNYAELGW